jgi:ABC-2 type transport system permease protein
MRLYFEIAKKSFQRHLTYRAANLAGIATNTFFGAIYVFVYLALFRERGTVGGINARDTVTYVIISQSLLMAMSAFANRDLSEAIIKGDIVMDFIRPVDFYAFWAALDCGRAVYYLVFRGIPTFVIGWALFGVRFPDGPATWALFLICLALGMSISFTFRFVTSTLAFWSTDARGVNYLTGTLIMFFAGFIVPLNFFPPWLRTIAEWLPFRALGHLPISVYLGIESGPSLAQAMAVEASWLVILILGGRFMLRQMTRRLSSHGG